jgi:hypothetical protein
LQSEDEFIATFKAVFGLVVMGIILLGIVVIVEVVSLNTK